jgi:hypothetical protein
LEVGKRPSWLEDFFDELAMVAVGTAGQTAVSSKTPPWTGVLTRLYKIRLNLNFEKRQA